MGTNGSGKSTLSNILAGKKGYEVSGNVLFENKDLFKLETEERERYSQHKVRIKFARATYEQVNLFTSYVRAESPYMFLSEVKIEPRYPARPGEITKYDALFVVSSVEFVN